MTSHLFPRKLHRMLEETEKNRNDDIVSWVHDGRAFQVHKRLPFVETIMKQYFNQSKFKSFQRQLNLWGFERTEDGSYFHVQFVRGKPNLSDWMVRTRIKGTTASTGASGATATSTSSIPEDKKMASSKDKEAMSSLKKHYYNVGAQQGSGGGNEASKVLSQEQTQPSLHQFAIAMNERTLLYGRSAPPPLLSQSHSLSGALGCSAWNPYTRPILSVPSTCDSMGKESRLYSRMLSDHQIVQLAAMQLALASLH